MLGNAQLDGVEQLFGIKFSEAERKLLTTSKSLLDYLDRQRAYLLRQYIAPSQCPACLKPTCVRAAADGCKDGMDWDGIHPDEDHHCQRCGARIVMRMPLAGDIFFTLHPDEARAVKA